jgi:hypothetical protein
MKKDETTTDTTETTTAAAPVAKAAPFAFKVKKHVTVPLLKLVNNVPVYVKFTGEIFTGKVVDDKKEAPQMANVVDLTTGQEMQIILGTVLVGNLQESYPDAGYVNKQFELVKNAPEGTRKYSLYQITEIEI